MRKMKPRESNNGENGADYKNDCDNPNDGPGGGGAEERYEDDAENDKNSEYGGGYVNWELGVGTA
jgi:hypothetical protein